MASAQPTGGVVVSAKSSSKGRDSTKDDLAVLAAKKLEHATRILPDVNEADEQAMARIANKARARFTYSVLPRPQK